MKTMLRCDVGLDNEGLNDATCIVADTDTVRVLSVSGVPDTGECFPMYLEVVDAKVELLNSDMYPSVSIDPCYNLPILQSNHFSEWLDSDAGHTVIATIKIDRYLPEWVEMGKALCNTDGYDVASDDELMAATYIHHQMLKVTGCVAIWCWQW